MSGIEITVGNATAQITPVDMVDRPGHTVDYYQPLDLLNATHKALLAINSGESDTLAEQLSGIIDREMIGR